MKTCTKCNIEKPLNQYNKQKGGALSLTSYCKDCLALYKKDWYDNGGSFGCKERARVNSLAKNYGITDEEYKACMATSDHCGICNSLNDLCYDHDHRTNEFRGVLCRRCNAAVGTLGDNLEGLERAIKYLKGKIK